MRPNLPLVMAIALPSSSLAVESSLVDYMTLRDATLQANEDMSFSRNTKLNAEEEKASSYIQQLLTTYTKQQRDDHSFPPTTFFHSWDLDAITQTPLYNIIASMPKGGATHLHSGSSGSTNWIVDEGITLPHCYVYWPSSGQDDGDQLAGTIAFYPPSANVTAPPPGYLPASTVPKDELLQKLTSNNDLKNMDSSTAWSYFSGVFARTGPAMSYVPFYVAYLKNTFDVHFNDNVQHIEIRVVCGSGGLGDLWDEDGTYSEGGVVDIYRRALREWKEEGEVGGASRRDFTLRIILSSIRNLPPEHIEQDVEDSMRMIVDNKDLVIGFDIVAEEDPGYRTLDYIDTILALKQKELDTGVNLPLYFHDGESNDRNDTNMVDAILLGSKRVGHGFNSYYFPILFDKMRENHVVLEVNPISNQVLRYVDNLEVHPANAFMANGVDIVISSDDPGIFGYTGLSLDMWTALVSFQLNLKELKTLCYNSLEYSGLGDHKERAIFVWETKWAMWVEEILKKLTKSK